MASSGLLCDFDDITAQHGPAGLYCHSLSQLYEVCIKDESILHPITYNDACQRLKRNVNNTLATLDVRGYPIIEFKFGRSFTTAKTKCKLRPDKPITWNQDKGIASDWKEILKEGYDGVAVLTCINKELVPNYIQDVIKFKSSNGTRQKNQHGIDHRFYAQGLLNALIQHYTFSEPDGRIRNSCFASDKKDNDAALPEILYMAFKVEKRPEKVKSLRTAESQTVAQQSEHADVTTVSAPAVTTETGSECTYRVVYPEQETRKLVKIPKSDIKNIKSKLSAAFNLSRDLSLTYMLYMPEDDEWYECEEEDLPTRGKLKIAVEQPKVQASSSAKSSNSQQQQQERKVQSVQPFKQKKATAVVKKAKKNITHKHSSIVQSVKKVTALKRNLGLLKGKSSSSSSRSISLHKSKPGSTRSKAKSTSQPVVQKTSKRSISPVKSAIKTPDAVVKKEAQNSRKRSAQFSTSPSPAVKRIKTEGPSQSSCEARVSPVSAKSVKKISQEADDDDQGDVDEQILVKDLEPGTHQKKLKVEVSVMEKSLMNKFRQLDCVFNMHFEDSTGDIYGYVQPGELYNSLESGQMYEISNFAVSKSPDNVYGLSLDHKAVVRKISRPSAIKSARADTPKHGKNASPSKSKSKDSPKSITDWTEQLDRKLMDIHRDMKRDFDSNNWKYVAERMGTGHTNEQCRIRVRRIQTWMKTKNYLAPETDLDKIRWTDSTGTVHKMVWIQKSETPCQRRKCVYCVIKRHKTKTGGMIETNKKCQQCDKPLCYGRLRDCFTRYHEELCTAENTYEKSDHRNEKSHCLSVGKGKGNVSNGKNSGNMSESFDGRNVKKEKGASSSKRKKSGNINEKSDSRNTYMNKSEGESMSCSENIVNENNEMSDVIMSKDDCSYEINKQEIDFQNESESKEAGKYSETSCEMRPEITSSEKSKCDLSNSEKRDDNNSMEAEISNPEMMNTEVNYEKRDEIDSQTEMRHFETTNSEMNSEKRNEISSEAESQKRHSKTRKSEIDTEKRDEISSETEMRPFETTNSEMNSERNEISSEAEIRSSEIRKSEVDSQKREENTSGTEIRDSEVRNTDMNSEKRDEISSKAETRNSEMGNNDMNSEKRDKISSESEIGNSVVWNSEIISEMSNTDMNSDDLNSEAESQNQRCENVIDARITENETNSVKENLRKDKCRQSGPSITNHGDTCINERVADSEQFPVVQMETESEVYEGTMTCVGSQVLKLGENQNDNVTAQGDHIQKIPSIGSVEGVDVV